LKDIADLWHMFSVPVVVEGHTKDIGGGSDKFWKEVANNRAPWLMWRSRGVGKRHWQLKTPAV
jgi:hypothetical protein